METLASSACPDHLRQVHGKRCRWGFTLVQLGSAHGHSRIDTTARTDINKDILFRKWVAIHGGVYVPPTDKTPPNSYLKVPDRDVVTTTGKVLTLMNPAYALRELQSLNDDLSSKTHITSLKLLNPHNASDEWESGALKSFEQGSREAMEVTQVDRPFYQSIGGCLASIRQCSGSGYS